MLLALLLLPVVLLVLPLLLVLLPRVPLLYQARQRLRQPGRACAVDALFASCPTPGCQQRHAHCD